MIELILFIGIPAWILYFIKLKQIKNKKYKSKNSTINNIWDEITNYKQKVEPYRPNKKVKQYIKTYENTKGTLLTTKKISEKLNIKSQIINQTFIDLAWTIKKEKWTLATEQGFIHGAEEAYSKQYKIKYVMWQDDIIENKTFLDALKQKTFKKTSYQEKQIKGAEYEEYVAKIYRSRGYFVSEYGKEKGKKDGGIDLIAKKERHLVLIQCKNWNEKTKWKITHKDIKAFQTDARTFVEDKPLLRACNLTARYSISGDIIHASAIKHLEDMQKIGKRVDYEIVRMEYI